MGKFIDLTGQRFGRLTANKRIKDENSGKYKWLCSCDCGGVKLASTSHLRAGTVKSCGCSTVEDIKKKLTIDLTGQQFGKLTVVEKDTGKKTKGTYWIVKCECGNIKSVTGSYLRKWNPTSCGCEPKFKYTEGQLLQSLRDFVERNGYPTNVTKDFRLKNGLPDMTNYKNAFGGGLADWLELCGYELSDEERHVLNSRGVPNELSKSECERRIRSMQNSLNRALMYDDFRHPQNGSVGINQVKKYWGTVNRMKKELGLEINRESMVDKTVTQEVLSHDIEAICNRLKEEDRDFLTTKEIDTFSFCSNYTSLKKSCLKYYGKGLDEVFLEKGIHFGERGRGIKHTFSDGECTTSMSEYLFSGYLRKRGLKFGTDYIRDVKYSGFVRSYNGNMNCDYVIFYNGRTIYIEIAGVLMEHKKRYYQNLPLTNSKSKEAYRLKLKEKEEMLLSEVLEYYILFPCDLTDKNLDMILSSENPNCTRKIIECFNKTYVDWEKVENSGELRYNCLTGCQV